MATVYINGQDLAALVGFQLSKQGSTLDGMMTVPDEVTIPTVVGSFFTGPGKVAAREFRLAGFLLVADAATARTNLRLLEALLDQGEVTVELADRTDILIRARCIAVETAPRDPQVLSPVVEVTLVFRASSPYWRDALALPYGFGATMTAMPQGNASVAPVIWIYGAATNPVLTGYDHMGTALWSATFTITLAATDALKIVTSAFDMTIWKYVNSATGVLDDTLLTAGVFPRPFHSSRAVFQFSQWGALSVSAGTGRAVYPRHFL
jgi:hypothetical protein